MIRTLTIIENQKDDGTLEYTANGSFPIDEAAKALVIIAYQSIPQTAQKKEDGVPVNP
jgi:hypothetical protein